jgi:hypothetical protein
MRDAFLDQIEDAKGCGRPHERSCRGSHDYTALWKSAEGPLTFDADIRLRVAMLIGSGEPLHELLQDSAARLRLNMRPRQL